MLVAKPDRETVPQIDQADQRGEIDQLLIVEVSADFVVDRVGCMRLRDPGEGFRPRKSGALALRVEG